MRWTLLLILNINIESVVSSASVCYAIATDAYCTLAIVTVAYCYPTILVPLAMFMGLFIFLFYSLYKIFYCSALA